MSEARKTAKEIAKEALPCAKTIGCWGPAHISRCPASNRPAVAAAIEARDRSWEEELRKWQDAGGKLWTALERVANEEALGYWAFTPETQRIVKTALATQKGKK